MWEVCIAINCKSDMHAVIKLSGLCKVYTEMHDKETMQAIATNLNCEAQTIHCYQRLHAYRYIKLDGLHKLKCKMN